LCPCGIGELVALRFVDEPPNGSQPFFLRKRLALGRFSDYCVGAERASHFEMKIFVETGRGDNFQGIGAAR
jgi:hypothetical protein